MFGTTSKSMSFQSIIFLQVIESELILFEDSARKTWRSASYVVSNERLGYTCTFETTCG